MEVWCIVERKTDKYRTVKNRYAGDWRYDEKVQTELDMWSVRAMPTG